MLVSEKNTEGCEWTGDKMNVTPLLDASLGLVDIQVRLKIVSSFQKYCDKTWHIS